MREKLARFMAGRYGNDNLNKSISIAAVVFLIISLITARIVPYISTLCWVLAIVLIAVCYYRMLSRDISKRSMENQKFMSLRYQAAVKKQRRAERAAQSKDYKFFKCPKCGVLNRIPRGKGKIQITCPKCGEQFIRTS